MKPIKAWAPFFKDKICRDQMGDIELTTRKERWNLGHYPKPWSIREVEIRLIKTAKKKFKSREATKG